MDDRFEYDNLYWFFVKEKNISHEEFVAKIEKLKTVPVLFKEFKHQIFGYQSEFTPMVIGGITAKKLQKEKDMDILDSYLYMVKLWNIFGK